MTQSVRGLDWTELRWNATRKILMRYASSTNQDCRRPLVTGKLLSTVLGFQRPVTWTGWPHDQSGYRPIVVLEMAQNISQPSLPTPFYSVLVTLSVFMTLSTVFHSINFPDNSPLSHSVLPVSFLPHLSFQLYISMKVSLSPDVILCGWPGLKHQLTN